MDEFSSFANTSGAWYPAGPLAAAMPVVQGYYATPPPASEPTITVEVKVTIPANSATGLLVAGGVLLLLIAAAALA